jgi:16S rRNA (uracil1498-N3)-methyltransferase
MTDRYYAETPISGPAAKLTGPEAHHLIHVMRASPGSRVILFDGSGAEFTARVERVGRAEVELTILSRTDVDRESSPKLTLGVSLPKGDRQKWLVEKTVELGVRRFVPLATARSVAQAGPKALARLRRTVIEASKQCGRNRLMEITEPQSWSDFLAATQAVPCRLLAHPSDETSRSVPATPDTAVLAVGPEGGFTPDEVAQATASGWRPINLGPRILRVETAAILLIATVVQSAQS